MRILFALPGLHRIDRGAEIAFTSVAAELAARGHDVVLAGSGGERKGTSYRFVHVPSISRQYFERLPTMPIFRDITTYEELTFVPGLLWKYRPSAFDVTVTCSFPFTNWVLRRPAIGQLRPAHIFVTQNGDWPARSTNAEYKLFGCEGLVCINPDFYEANKSKWFSVLIPNGVDTEKFKAGKSNRKQFGLSADRRIVLMVSAIIQSKRGAEPNFYNTAWTIQLIRGLMLWLASIIAAPLVARFYGVPILGAIFPIIGMIFAIQEE